MTLQFDVPGNDLSRAGEVSGELKKVFKQIGLPSTIIRRTAICIYEGEINMIIHAGGGASTVEISPGEITIRLEDTGPGIEDVDLAMQEGYSTAPEETRALGFGAGMGLPNMKKNSDEFEITTSPGEGTRVFMKITL
jgi:anti-sigma regulatory factor (Ser/Thr protein kinase)